MDSGVIVAAVSIAGGVVIWAIRLEGRINLVDQRTNSLAEDIKYIRERIDTALNGRKPTP